MGVGGGVDERGRDGGGGWGGGGVAHSLAFFIDAVTLWNFSFVFVF